MEKLISINTYQEKLLILFNFSEEQEYIKTARFCGLAKQSRNKL